MTYSPREERHSCHAQVVATMEAAKVNSDDPQGGVSSLVGHLSGSGFATIESMCAPVVPW